MCVIRSNTKTKLININNNVKESYFCIPARSNILMKVKSSAIMFRLCGHWSTNNFRSMI